MKLRWIIWVGLAVITAGGLFLLLRPPDSEQKAVASTRRLLRQQGFKTDLADFDFSTSDEMRARVAVLTNTDFTRAAMNRIGYPRRSALEEGKDGKPDLMESVSPDAAIVVWKQKKLESYFGEDIWPLLGEMLDECRPELDAACAAALPGHLRFSLDASHGFHMLLPHLPALTSFTRLFGRRAVLELHRGNQDAAWTNLLAATRLATAYEPDLSEVSHLVRFKCVALAFNATWQMLQADGWPDERLTGLQHEWESLDFFKNLPETAAFLRAGTAAACREERRQPVPSTGLTIRQAFHSPRAAWRSLERYWERVQYRHHGTYEDEKALFLHYRDRELELRRVVQSPTWAAMCQLPGVTNPIPFKSQHDSTWYAMLDNKQFTRRLSMEGRGLPGRAAEAESRRRLLITALALERYHVRHGTYPNALDELTPEFLMPPPTDFMDGLSLRYRLTDDGHFVLYSVGLDCIDDGGELERQTPRDTADEDADQLPSGLLTQEGRDLVWPRPATAEEVQAKRVAQAQALEELMARQKRMAELRYTRTMAALEGLHAEQQNFRIAEVTYLGKPLSKLLRNEKAAGTNQLDLHEMLTLRPVITGREPRILTCELAIKYDAVTNIGSLRLLVDVEPGENSSGGGGSGQACLRAANGNCRLIWNTSYDAPGQHFLQARLHCTERLNDWRNVDGPVLPFYSSNLCQFFPASGMFNSSGAILYGKLAESNATYSIELKSLDGGLLRTLTGATTNGVIDLDWDLKDERGNTHADEAFEAVFHVTLTKSKRSQAQEVGLYRMR